MGFPKKNSLMIKAIYICHDKSTISNDWCILVQILVQKIIFKAISFFKGMQWEKKQIYVSEKEEALLLKSIEIIQKGL